MAMVRKSLLSVLFTLAAWSAAAATDKGATPDMNQSVTFSGGVTAQRDLVYGAMEGYRPLTLDLYQLPSKPKDMPRPAIVFIHGGGWLSGDARHLNGFPDFPATLAALAGKGYVVASVNYRLAGEAKFPAAVQDVKSALRWLRGHAGDYNIDTTRVMAWGAEAGGQIAAMVGTSCGVTTLEPAADAKTKARLASDCVEGVVDWYGPSDPASWEAGAARAAEATTPSTLGAYLGCEPGDCAPGMVPTASPLSYIESMTPPFLIQHGAADTRVPPDQSQKLHDALRAKNVPADILIYPGLGADFTNAGAPDAAASAKALADMEDFIARTFPPPAKPAAANASATQTKTVKPKPTKARR